MKRIASLLLPVATAFLAAGCSQLEPESTAIPVEEETLIHKTFVAGSADTRTTLDGVDILFAEGESISIYDGTANRKFTADEAGSNVSITGEVSETATAFYALSPYSESTVFSTNGSTVTASTSLSANQTATAGSFADGANIAAAQSDSEDSFSLQNLLAVAKFTLSSANLGGHSISSVTLTSSSYPLAGDVIITYGETCTIEAGTSTSKSVTISPTDGSAFSDGTYYMTLLPNAGGEITLTFTATDGYTATKTATLGSAFTAGTIKNLGSVKNLTWEEPKYYFEQVSEVSEGTYLIVANSDSKLLAAKAVIPDTGVSYGYPQPDDVTENVQNGYIVMSSLDDAFVFTNTTNGYTIQQLYDGYYWYQSGNYASISVASSVSSDSYYTITYNSDGTFNITSKSNSCYLQYSTSYGSFGSYKSASGVVPTLYKLTTPEPTITTVQATDITVSSATLNATFANLGTTNVQDAHFVWGTSQDNLCNELPAEDFDVTTGAFQATLSSLKEGTTIYYQAILQYCTDGTNYILLSGDVLSFTTSSSSSGGNAGLQWLGCYEMPAIDLSNTSSYSGTGTETFGGSDGACWYNYVTTNSMQKVITHTYIYNKKTYRNYTTLVDGDKRCPLWTAYAMNSDAYPDNNVGRAGSFSESTSYDPGIAQAWQSSGSTSDYNSGNGYARGHHCASADRQTTSDANKQTFYYTNQSPQWQNNFNSGVWSSLEEAIRNNAVSSGRDTLYIVVGTLFEDGNTGDSNDGGTVARPSHFYKLLMKCTFDTSGGMSTAKGIAYLYSNEAHSGYYYDSSFVTTIDAIESRTGFDFFTNVPETLQTAAEQMSTSLW